MLITKTSLIINIMNVIKVAHPREPGTSLGYRVYKTREVRALF